MKKYFILAAAMLLSSCACFSSDDEEEVYVPARETACARGDASCNKTKEIRRVRNYDEDIYYRRPRHSSYRILTAEDLGERNYRSSPVTVPAPAPQPQVIQVVQTPAPAPQPAPTVVSAPVVSGDKCNSCEPTIRETREPVEILYKKTTYKTVYEPKTTEEVSYEKVPYGQAKTDTVVQEVVTTTTTSTQQTPSTIMTVEERK